MKKDMDYEKKYNEALERAKNLYPGVHEHNKKMLEQIFPELRESEDEKMMREFNDWLCEEIECRTNDLRDEKDQETIKLAEDHAFLAGADWNEEEMLKGAAQGEFMLNPYPIICLDECKDYNFKDGDKVRIIIVKE